MATGTYAFDNALTTTSTYQDNYTVAFVGSFDRDVTLRAMTLRFLSGGAVNVKPVVYSNAGVLIASGPVQTFSASSNTPYEFPFTAPVALTGGTVYKLGCYQSASSVADVGVYGTNITFPRNDTSSPAWFNFTETAQHYQLGDVFPSTVQTGGYTIAGGFSVDVSNTAPTPTNLLPNNTFKDNRTVPARLSWTYSDAESNPQYKYEVNYRIRDSGAVWSVTTNTSANPYHDFATGTFTLGTEYEWMVRVDDNQGAGWGNYSSVAYFTSGTSNWTYGAATVSATQSGTIPGTPALTPGTYYVEVRTSDTEGFGPWSTQGPTFVINPANNTSTRVGGAWVLSNTTKKTRVAGVWKDVPPTKKYSTGTWS